MSFLPNIRQMAVAEVEKVLAEVEKIDLNRDGIPDLKQIQADAEAAVADLEALETKITPAEAAAALDLLFPGKFTAAEIATAEAAVGKLLASLAKLQAIATEARTQLLGQK